MTFFFGIYFILSILSATFIGRYGRPASAHVKSHLVAQLIKADKCDISLNRKVLFVFTTTNVIPKFESEFGQK